MSTLADHAVRLDFASRYELLEMVQTVLGQLAALAGFDDDTRHYMSVAVRESVVNAIKHGNKQDADKRVEVEFRVNGQGLGISVRDHGAGFRPDNVPDPLAPENLLKTDGRGIFFMRQFMDEVRYEFPPDGGTLVHMLKKRASSS